MKKTLLLLYIIILPTFTIAQNDSIPDDKAVVYFTRANGLGFLINFTYFDGKKAIGRFNGLKYMRYECRPGKHLFWARSENKSYVEADLKGGEIYIIDVIARMGGLKASVSLTPVDRNNYKLKRIQKLLTKKDGETFDEAELNSLQSEMTEVIDRGIKKYHKLREKGKFIPLLLPNMTVQKKDLVYVKKSKKQLP